MTQQYIAQQSAPTTPVTPQNLQELFFSPPVLGTLFLMTLTTGLSVAAFSHWFGHFLTSRREKRKTSEEQLLEARKLNIDTEYKLKTMRDVQKTMATKAGLTNANKSIKANGRAIKQLERKVDAGFDGVDKRFRDLDQKLDERFEAVNQKMDAGFAAITARLDNLLGK